MSRATRFSIAVHALAVISYQAQSGNRPSSDYIAGSVGTNPSFVRRVLAMLAHAGIVRSSAGVAGADLARPAETITLLEIYRAVGLEGESRLGIHGSPNPNCFVGKRIHGALDKVVTAAEDAFEAQLAQRRLSDIVADIEAVTA